MDRLMAITAITVAGLVCATFLKTRGALEGSLIMLIAALVICGLAAIAGNA